MMNDGGNTTQNNLSQDSNNSATKLNLSEFSGNNKNLLTLDEKLGILEEQLYQYLFRNVTHIETSNVTKFFLVPIGLPGMGKTTLSRFLSATS